MLHLKHSSQLEVNLQSTRFRLVHLQPELVLVLQLHLKYMYWLHEHKSCVKTV